MSANLVVSSPVSFDNSYRSEGLVELPSGDLLVSKGHSVYHVTPQWACTLWAGSGNGFENGPRLAARFHLVCGMVLVETRRLFMACELEYRIRLIESDMATTYAGNGELGCQDGPRLQASFGFPNQLIHHDNKLYITDYYRRLRVINMETGMVSSICGLEPMKEALVDGPFSSARMQRPNALCLASHDSILLCDVHALRKVDIRAQTITTVAGSSEPGFVEADRGRQARFSDLTGILPLPDGDFLVSDGVNHRIRKISPLNKYKTTTIVGNSVKARIDGPLDLASLSYPSALLLTTKGDLVWTEIPGLRVIEGFARLFYSMFNFWSTFHPEMDQLPSDAILALSDIEFIHAHPDETGRNRVKLHSTVFRSEETGNGGLAHAFQRLQELHFPFDMYLVFFSLFYGSTNIFTPTEQTSNTAPHAVVERLGLLIRMAEAFPSPSLRIWLEASLESNSTSTNSSPSSSSSSSSEEVVILDPEKLMRRHLKKLLTSDITISDTPDSMPHAFSLGVVGEDGKRKWIVAHDWVLYCRWSYFRRMIAAGLEEAVSRCVSLPSDFSESLLLAIINILYTDACDITSISGEDCQYALDNAEEFGFRTFNGSPASPGFATFLSSCENVSNMYHKHH